MVHRILPDFRTRDIFEVARQIVKILNDAGLEGNGLCKFLVGFLDIEKKSSNSFEEITILTFFRVLEYAIHTHTSLEVWRYDMGHYMEEIWDTFYWYNTNMCQIEKPPVNIVPQPKTVLGLGLGNENLFHSTKDIMRRLHTLKVCGEELKKIYDDMLVLIPTQPNYTNFHFARYDHRIPANVIMSVIDNINVPGMFKDICLIKLSKERTPK